MTKNCSILLALLLPMLAWAQLAEYPAERMKVFIAPVIEIGEIAGETGLSSGVMGGLRFENLWLGAYGLRQYRFCYQNALEESCEGKTNYLGAWTGWEQPVHESLAVYGGMRAAWGLIELDKPNSRFNDADYYDHVFVMTPEVGMTWQVLPHVQLAWMAGYRWVSGMENLPGLTNKDFGSIVNSLSIRIGL